MYAGDALHKASKRRTLERRKSWNRVLPSLSEELEIDVPEGDDDMNIRHVGENLFDCSTTSPSCTSKRSMLPTTDLEEVDKEGMDTIREEM